MLLIEDIKVSRTYTSPRWDGARKVVDLKRHRVHGNWVTVVHYIDQRTCRTGTAIIEVFAKRASKQLMPPREVAPC